MIHPEVKLLSRSGLVELENKLSVPKTQWWDRHMMRVIDIPIPKGRKRKEKKCHWSQEMVKSSRASFIQFQGLGIINPLWLDALPLGSRLCPQSHSFFPLKGSTCLLLSSFSLYPSSKILGVQNPSLISSYLFFFQANQAVFPSV